MHNNIEQNGLVRLALDRITAGQRGELVVVSDGVHNSLKKYAPWLLYRPAQVIKNGIADQNKEEKGITRESLGLKKSHFIVGSVGRFEKTKNYGLLLTAFALLYDDHEKARLVLVGQGSQEDFLRNRAYDLGIDDRVVFIVGKDAKPYYDIFDSFVLTSPREGISLALLEAMQAGIACIVTHDSVSHDVIEDQVNGFLSPVGNAVVLAQKLEQLIKTPALGYRIAQEGKKRIASDFKIKTMIQEYKKLYKQLASERF